MHQEDRCSGPGAVWLLMHLVWWMEWTHLHWGEPFQLCFFHSNQNGHSDLSICNNIAETELYTATMMSSGTTWNTELNIKRDWCAWGNISVLPASLDLCTHLSYDCSMFLCLALLGVFSLYFTTRTVGARSLSVIPATLFLSWRHLFLELSGLMLPPQSIISQFGCSE